ncbi:MAG: hypothetical protein BM557_06490 [Flavobacterium sp. MedPE-SWcel]|uniref:hypothetical protein n=1 Tax=uncultured Flavobacterium sp. TaxID=165435 RepID=UPI000919E2D3|nr:hypothetical protein [uncultured Flavobacterium sp.]OIQ19348.1 MAG: hypothetical protein BM557_06490 [Flavobacterium sp. MedPE-SWcel]
MTAIQTSDDSLFNDSHLEIEGNAAILKSFLQFGEENIKREIERLENVMPDSVSFNMDTKKGESEVKTFIDNFIQYTYNRAQYDFHFKQRLRQSIIIQLYSFMELYLTKQCEMYSVGLEEGVRFKDIKGNNELEKFKDFYKNSIKLNIVELDQKRWGFIKNLKVLRNKITHSQGKFSDEDTHGKLRSLENKKTYSLIKENASESYRIELEKDYIIVCIDEVSKFLKDLTVKR